jgi:hypothetical protein
MNGATYDLVMNLMRGFFEKGYNLYCDNYYTSPQLLWDLFQLGVNATGTFRSNRRGIPEFGNFVITLTYIPQEIKTKSLTNRGDLAIMNNGPMECIKFLDGKPVHMLSTVHESDMSATHRRDKDTNEIIMKPSMVVNYNKYVGGVDRSDQMISYTNSIVVF